MIETNLLHNGILFLNRLFAATLLIQIGSRGCGLILLLYAICGIKDFVLFVVIFNYGGCYSTWQYSI